ncbi:hypothetical protein HZA38_01725 [Candidatus Peregrinibacteria bacterium]|nr:hypothetical protein [Candidatus Peregrinibacteria bacterium]
MEILFAILYLLLSIRINSIPTDSIRTLPPDTESKRYMFELQDCPVVNYVCAEDETYFTDKIGCGCEKKANSDEKFCAEIYAPVCGKIEVQCIKAPCDPVEQTFSNRCFAEQAKAFDIVEGKCFGTEPAVANPELYKNTCGNGICEQLACQAIGCPPPESPESCPQDCKE